MDRKLLAFMIFFPTFLIMYFGMHFYAFFRLFGTFSWNMGFWFYSITIFFTLTYISSAFLQKVYRNIYTKIFYIASSIWMGMVFLLFSTFLVLEPFRIFFDMGTKTGVGVILFVILLSVYSSINHFFIRVKTIDVPFDAKLNIVHLSDLHIGTINNHNYMKKLVKKVNSLRPHVVLITGDLVDGSAPLNPSMFEPLKQINTRTYFVSGNHEFYEGLTEVIPIIKSANIEVLKNEIVDFKGAQIIGVEYSENKGHLRHMLSFLSIDKKKPTILMYHAPIELGHAHKAGVDLMLSGHTHAGQIFPFTFFVWLAYPRFNGLYKYKDTHLYVSPGTGTWGPPMRLGSFNEITLLKLKKK
ncbi:metallophosphoesterase [Candidatus Woesearchaeota archaeon]|nr:metallophosphoesterase [Candidatus Woesearchaeota archaeon]